MKGAARFDADVGESAVPVVTVERGGRGVIRHVNVGPAIVVKICYQDAEAVSAVGFPHP